MGRIKRTQYANQREQQAKNWNRRMLINRDGMVCGICKEPIEKMSDVTIDHIEPASKGGTDKLENLRLAHEFCNNQRGSGFFNER